MNCSSSRVTGTVIKWILCFISEKENVISDISICDSLEDMNLENFFADLSADVQNLMLTEFKINDYDAIKDPLNVFEPEKEQQSNANSGIVNANTNQYRYCSSAFSENKNELSSNRQRFVRDSGCNYRTIQIPVTKSLFMTVVNLTVTSDVKFSNNELYIVVDRLLTFLHDKRPFLRVLAQQFLDDPKLSDELNIIDKASIKEEEEIAEKNGKERNKLSGYISFNIKLQNAMCEASNFIDVVAADKLGNAARVAQNNENQLVVNADVASLSYFFKPRYMRMDGYFLINNHEFLSEVYDDVPSDFIVTVDIDFTNFFYDAAKKYVDEKARDENIAKKINQALACDFFELNCLEICIFRLMGIQSNLSFDTISDKQLHIYYKECIFDDNIQLPCNLKVLSIIDSIIYCDLVLPHTLETFILEKTIITVGCELRVTETCKNVIINRNCGLIHIPYFGQTFMIPFPSNGTFELSRNDEIVEKVTLINIRFYDSIITMPNNIQEIMLKNIVLDGIGLWVFPEDIKKITLEKFTGDVELKGFTQNEPLVGYFNDGTFRSYKSNESEKIELVFSSVYLTHGVYFHSNISKIIMSCVNINPDFSFKFNEYITEVSLDDCTCNLYLEKLPYFNQITLEKSSFGEPHQNLCFKRSGDHRFRHLFMSNLMIKETINFGPEIQDFKFDNIIVSGSSHISFDENFNQLELNGCKGRFKMPGIFSDDESRTITMDGNVHRFEIRRTKNDSFDILIDTLSLYKLTIEMNLRIIELYNIKVIEKVLITTHQCENLIMCGFYCPLSIPNIVSLKKLELSDFKNLNISSKMFTLTKNVTANVTSMNEDKNTGSSASDTNVYFPTIISDCCENISISRNKIPINITDVLRNATKDEELMRIMPGNKFEIVTCSLKHSSKLQLLGERICGTVTIEKDVCFLSLSRISSNEGSELWLNEGLESIQVESSQININGSNAKNLRAITLDHSTAIIYDPSIHTSLSYLNIREIIINYSLNLVPSVTTFSLVYSTLISSCSLKINEEISEIFISKSVGIIDMAGVAGLGKMRFDYECMLYFDKRASYNGEGLLHIENYTFKNDVMFSEDVKTVYLKSVKTVSNVKVTLGHKCTSLKLTSSNIDISFSMAKSLKKVILASVSLTVLQKILISLSTIEILILQDIILESSINLPDSIHTVVLEGTSLSANSQLNFNTRCSEVHFCNCIGMYNLSDIERLLALSLIPHCDDELEFKISLPSLENLRQLDIAYNLDNECFKHDLSKCINLEYLTVRSLYYSKKVTLYPSLSFIICDVLDFSGMNPWSRQKLSKFELGAGKFNNENINAMNLRMNIFINEIFTFNIRNKLRYLNLVGCGLDEENIELLKELVNLQTLVIDSAFFESDLVKNIPNQLETLEIVGKMIFDYQAFDLYSLNFKIVQELKKHENIKHLILGDSIKGYENIFDCLPMNLVSLKITRFSRDSVNFPVKNRKKVVIKQLILLLDDPNHYPPVLIDNNPMKRQYYKLFDHLQNFIDFNKLDDLVLEASSKFVSLDKETYRIN